MVPCSEIKVEEWPRPNGIRGRPNVGVIITHIPTGLFAICEEHRSQHKNKTQALKELEEKIISHDTLNPYL